MSKGDLWLPLLAIAALVAAPVPAVASTDYDVEIAADVWWTPSWSIGWGLWAVPSGAGSFTMSGDLEDEGTTAGQLAGWIGYGGYWWVTLTGDDGSLTVRIYESTWTVESGTGAYAGATGSGTATHSFRYVVSGWDVIYVYEWSLAGTVSL